MRSAGLPRDGHSLANFTLDSRYSSRVGSYDTLVSGVAGEQACGEGAGAEREGGTAGEGFEGLFGLLLVGRRWGQTGVARRAPPFRSASLAGGKVWRALDYGPDLGFQGRS